MGWLACLVLVVVSACTPAAEAQTRLIVTDSLGLPGINLTCLLMGCNVVRGLGDPNGQLFLETLQPILNPVTKLLQISLQLGVLSVEVDQVVSQQGPVSTGTPSYMTDETPVTYYGTTVWQGYLVQTGNQLVRTCQTKAPWLGRRSTHPSASMRRGWPRSSRYSMLIWRERFTRALKPARLKQRSTLPAMASLWPISIPVWIQHIRCCRACSSTAMISREM